LTWALTETKRQITNSAAMQFFQVALDHPFKELETIFLLQYIK
jgi:hypothetical protein